MILRITTVFIATAAVAYAAMFIMFWIVCKSMGHYTLEHLVAFTTPIVLSVAFGIEGVLWWKDRRFHLRRRDLPLG
ncbi:hypothetical protein [Rhizobium sp.]|uniref:hypothetical protein n=1 Tax=Rhizobium sp. TaxID=391 RepID=UPI0028A598C1